MTVRLGILVVSAALAAGCAATGGSTGSLTSAIKHGDGTSASKLAADVLPEITRNLLEPSRGVWSVRYVNSRRQATPKIDLRESNITLVDLIDHLRQNGFTVVDIDERERLIEVQ